MCKCCIFAILGMALRGWNRYDLSAILNSQLQIAWVCRHLCAKGEQYSSFGVRSFSNYRLRMLFHHLPSRTNIRTLTCSEIGSPRPYINAHTTEAIRSPSGDSEDSAYRKSTSRKSDLSWLI